MNTQDVISTIDRLLSAPSEPGKENPVNFAAVYCLMDMLEKEVGKNPGAKMAVETIIAQKKSLHQIYFNDNKAAKESFLASLRPFKTPAQGGQ